MRKSQPRQDKKPQQPEKHILEMSAPEIEAYVEKLRRKRGRPLRGIEKEKLARMREGPHRSIVLAEHQIQRGPGRPRIGLGAKEVLVSIERGLLAKADAYARSHKMSRSQLIAQALAGVVKEAG